MDEKQFTLMFHEMTRIADALERLARGSEPEEPNHIKALDQFAVFDWATIGASIVQSDQFGPTHVEWNGMLWTRRSPQNKFEGAIWFSRASGKDADGNVHYLRLITFREIKDADPLPAKVAEKASASPKNGNGNTRPYAPDKLRTRLAEKASTYVGKEASNKQRSMLAMLLNKCFAGESDAEEKRHHVQKYLFGVESLNDTFDSLILAALDWMKATKDSGGDYLPDPLAMQEAQKVCLLALETKS